MAELKSRYILSNEAFFETSKSINLDGDKDIVKYASKHMMNIDGWLNSVQNLKMRYRKGDLNLYNLKNELSIYINANSGILNVKEIANYINSTKLHTLDIYNASRDLLNSSIKKSEGKSPEKELYKRSIKVKEKIKLTSYEQKLLDYAEEGCRDKFFQKGVSSGELVPIAPVGVEKNLITIITFIPQLRATRVGTALNIISIIDGAGSDRNNTNAQVASGIGQGIGNYINDQYGNHYFTPEFSVKVDLDDTKCRNYNSSAVINDLKLLETMIKGFNTFVNNINREYLKISKIIQAWDMRKDVKEEDCNVKYFSMKSLNRETLNKVDQYANTIEDLIAFYNKVL